ncbi:hypothetical protein [Natrinema halophilum]|uniref:DUF8156 domain-containing protein n=1 Tax=Natrinema halophilum TaxID=1699371 RepID=A0A7D5KEW2_9EURY|nr:hypothetical protein [Natrinema halophilum]QLG50556.1 hypothetical protein HYG82_17745 [Natrinema halophilum]
MGRTNPTYRDALRDLESEWEPMRRALRREYQDDFDRLFDRAREFADAAGYANPTRPERALVLSLLLAHEVELRRLRAELAALEDEGCCTSSTADAADSAADAGE